MATNVKRKGGGLAQILADLQAVAGQEVLVGFPESTTTRDANEPGGDLTNATLGYIHDNGEPAANIPARPFMLPGIMDAREKITDKLGQILKASLAGKGPGVIDQGMHQVGIIAKLSIQNTINAGIAPALADSTLAARARRGRKGAKQELANRAAGLPPSTDLAKPLIDTGQLRNAVNYAIRSRKKRGK